MEDFNAGQSGATELSEGGMEIVNMLLKIKTVTVEKTKSREGDEYMRLNIEVINEGKDSMNIYQPLSFSKDGKVKGLCYPSFTGSDGKEILGSPVYDILHASKEYDLKTYEARQKEAKDIHGSESWISKNFMEGLKFKMDVKILETKEGTLMFPLTQRQIKADEDYQKRKEAEKKYSATKDDSKGSTIDPDDLPF